MVTVVVLPVDPWVSKRAVTITVVGVVRTTGPRTPGWVGGPGDEGKVRGLVG